MVQIYRAKCMICRREVPLELEFKDEDSYAQVLQFINTYAMCPQCYYPNPRLYESHLYKIFVTKVASIDMQGMIKWLIGQKV